MKKAMRITETDFYGRMREVKARQMTQAMKMKETWKEPESIS